MPLADIRTALKTILETVDGIGIVHDYDRWSVHWKTFLEHYKTAEGKINGCSIRRVAAPSERGTNPYLRRRHLFVVKYIYGVRDADATGVVFDDLIEAVMNSLNSNYKLATPAAPNGVAGVENSGPMQLKVSEDRMFGDVFCHFAELEYEIRERLVYNL